ncbi:hypothetical protein CCAND95_230012 [Capnocytophaga canis]|uniref:Uncharacterized protein n=1 Tax=Capnocytophaga canis TaxID=1848903 RepID=A0A0B7I207_9FLAO|nr:hypothetical protein CCAND95_230012 [Capnocytophaga canis]CEN44784.1 hypothetical protein CCAND38_20003 [Capnocytophaga canis]
MDVFCKCQIYLQITHVCHKNYFPKKLTKGLLTSVFFSTFDHSDYSKLKIIGMIRILIYFFYQKY